MPWSLSRADLVVARGAPWRALVLQLQVAIGAGQEPVSECIELMVRHVAGVRDRRCVACSDSVWQSPGPARAGGTISVP